MAIAHKYVQRINGEGFTVESGDLTFIGCDCGLAHAMILTSEGKKPIRVSWQLKTRERLSAEEIAEIVGHIGLSAKRNNRATAQRRRHATSRTDKPTE